MSPTDEPTPRAARERPLILIVEDQPELRQLYVQELALSGFDVIEAENGADALTHTASHAPDVVLMDLSLPIIDGWEATRRLKASPETSSTPIVALTAHAMASDHDKALAAGCDDYDTKPIDLDRLLLKIHVLLGRRPPS
jgi:CheY-like chemotaxis protein